MFLDSLIKLIRAPFDFVRFKILGVKNIKSGIQGDFARLKGTIDEMKGGAQGMADSAKGAAGKAQDAQGQAQAAGAAAQEKKGMFGFFSKKKKCPGCGQKLHPSWDVCPYCGFGEKAPAAAAAPAPTPAVKQRTMAIDMNAKVERSTSAGVGWLVPMEGQQQGEVLQVKGRTTVGTGSDCDLVLADPSISSRHCEFIAGQNGFRLTDLGSTNGTYVNEKRITSEELIDGDIVKLGRTSFKFKAMI